MNAILQIGIVIIYFAALQDFYAISSRPASFDRRRPRTRLVAPLAVMWILLYGVMLMIGFVLGDARLRLFSIGQIVNGMFFFPLAVAGMHFKNRLGTPSLPWLWAWRKHPRHSRLTSVAKRTGVKNPLLLLVFLFLAPFVFSIVLFTIVPPSMSEQAADALRLGSQPSLATILLILNLLFAAPLVEEIIFRHYLQTRLIAFFRRILPHGQSTGASLAVAAGIAISTLLFAFSHTNILTNDWLKYSQIIVLGVSLGWCQWRLGTEASIALHYTFNFSVLLASPLLKISA